ncbi:hypothetical protein GGI25_006514, partial [Coemansia spiralis]
MSPVGSANCLLIGGNGPGALRPYALHHVDSPLNRLPKKPTEMVPALVFLDGKLGLDKLCTFGSKTMVLLPVEP